MSLVIWTNHLKERIAERGLSPRDVETAIHFPDKVERSSATNSQKHIKSINGKTIVAAVKKTGNDWLVTSAWSKSYYVKPKDKSWFLERVIYSLLGSLEQLFGRSSNR